MFNSDDVKFGGTGVSNGTLTAREEPMHNEQYRIALDLPPMSVLYFEIKNKRTPPSELLDENAEADGQSEAPKAEPAEKPAEEPKDVKPAENPAEEPKAAAAPNHQNAHRHGKHGKHNR